MIRRLRTFVGAGSAALALALVVVGVVWWQHGSLREPKSSGSQKRVRLLTEDQYLNTLAYVFGSDVKPAVNFAAVTRTDGLLGVGTSFVGLTDAQLEIYQRTAAAVASQVVRPESREFLVPCAPQSADAADARCAPSS